MTKARKDHVCSLCHTTIKKGEDYVYCTITIWDHPDNDTFGTYKAHNQCDAVWNDGLGKYCDWRFPLSNREWGELL